MITTTEPSLAQAVQALGELEGEQARLSAEADALRSRLSEITAGEFDRMDAIGAAHHAVIAAAKRESP